MKKTSDSIMTTTEFFKKGNDYKCIDNKSIEYCFTKNKIYKCSIDGFLINDNSLPIRMLNTSICLFEDITISKPEIEKPVIEDIEDKVNHPKHYTNGPKIILDKDYKAGDIINIECIDVIRNMPAWKANVIKYLWRESLKEEKGYSIDKKAFEDCKKAKWYLDNKINELLLKERYNIK